MNLETEKMIGNLALGAGLGAIAISGDIDGVLVGVELIGAAFIWQHLTHTRQVLSHPAKLGPVAWILQAAVIIVAAGVATFDLTRVVHHLFGSLTISIIVGLAGSVGTGILVLRALARWVGWVNDPRPASRP